MVVSTAHLSPLVQDPFTMVKGRNKRFWEQDALVMFGSRMMGTSQTVKTYYFYLFLT